MSLNIDMLMSIPLIPSSRLSTGISNSTQLPTLASSSTSSLTTSTSTSRSTESSASSTTSDASALSPEALNGLARSLPKYLIAGGIVLAILLLLGSISWYWKQRRRRARFVDDEEWAGIKAGTGLAGTGTGSRRSSEWSEKVSKTACGNGARGGGRRRSTSPLVGRIGEGESPGSSPTVSCGDVTVHSALSTPVKERKEEERKMEEVEGELGMAERSSDNLLAHKSGDEASPTSVKNWGQRI